MSGDKSICFASTSCDGIIVLNIVAIKITFVMGKKMEKVEIEDSKNLTYKSCFSIAYFIFFFKKHNSIVLD